MAILSLIALVLSIVLGSILRINVGIIAIASALVLGFFADGLTLPELIAEFPNSLFLTLLGVTLLFGYAQFNGTLEKVTHGIISLFRGNLFWIPICFFLLTLCLSAIGAGNIAATALVAPAAMISAKELKISPFLMVIMVANGANAGGLSPVAPTGIIAAARMTQLGLPNLSWTIFLNSLIVHVLIAFGGYMFFGGYKLFNPKRTDQVATQKFHKSNFTLELKHWVTLGIILMLFIAVIAFKLDIVIGSFIAVAILSLLRVSEEAKVFKNIPWEIIVMVCGVSLLTNLMSRVGGFDLFTNYIAMFCDQHTTSTVIGFFSALVSVYSSSSGVVLPTFLSLIPQLVAKIPGINPVNIASSISISAHLVDVSPLSTVGALCLASVVDAKENDLLFNKMILWGLSMTIVATVICYIFF